MASRHVVLRQNALSFHTNLHPSSYLPEVAALLVNCFTTPYKFDWEVSQRRKNPLFQDGRHVGEILAWCQTILQNVQCLIRQNAYLYTKSFENCCRISEILIAKVNFFKTIWQTLKVVVLRGFSSSSCFGRLQSWKICHISNMVSPFTQTSIHLHTYLKLQLSW